MKITKKVISLVMVFCFLVNNLSFANQNLAAPSDLDDIMCDEMGAGIHHKDIGRIELILEAKLRFAAPNNGKMIDRDLLVNQLRETVCDAEGREAVRFLPSKLIPLRNRNMRVPCLVKYKGDKKARRYAAVFSLDADENNSFLRRVYTEKQYDKIKDHPGLKAVAKQLAGVRSTKELPARNEIDRDAIDRYKQHEIGVDAAIRIAHGREKRNFTKYGEKGKFVYKLDQEWYRDMIRYLCTVMNIKVENPDKLIELGEREAYLVRLTPVIKSTLQKNPASVRVLADVEGGTEVYKVVPSAHSSDTRVHYFIDNRTWIKMFGKLYPSKKAFDRGDHEFLQEADIFNGPSTVIPTHFGLSQETVGVFSFVGDIAHEIGAECNRELFFDVMHHRVMNDTGLRYLACLAGATPEDTDDANILGKTETYTIANLSETALTRDYVAGLRPGVSDYEEDEHGKLVRRKPIVLDDIGDIEQKDIGMVKAVLAQSFAAMAGKQIHDSGTINLDLNMLTQYASRKLVERLHVINNDEYIEVFFADYKVLPQSRIIISCVMKRESRKLESYYAVVDIRNAHVDQVFTASEHKLYGNSASKSCIPELVPVSDYSGVNPNHQPQTLLPKRKPEIQTRIDAYMWHQLAIDMPTAYAHQLEEETKAKGAYVTEIKYDRYYRIVRNLAKLLNIKDTGKWLLDDKKKCYIVKLTPKVKRAFSFKDLAITVQYGPEHLEGSGRSDYNVGVALPPQVHTSQGRVHIYLEEDEYDAFVKYIGDGKDLKLEENPAPAKVVADMCGIPLNQATVAGVAGRFAYTIGERAGLKPHILELADGSRIISNDVRDRLDQYLRYFDTSKKFEEASLSPVDLNGLSLRHSYLAGEVIMPKHAKRDAENKWSSLTGANLKDMGRLAAEVDLDVRETRGKVGFDSEKEIKEALDCEKVINELRSKGVTSVLAEIDGDVVEEIKIDYGRLKFLSYGNVAVRCAIRDSQKEDLRSYWVVFAPVARPWDKGLKDSYVRGIYTDDEFIRRTNSKDSQVKVHNVIQKLYLDKNIPTRALRFRQAIYRHYRHELGIDRAIKLAHKLEKEEGQGNHLYKIPQAWYQGVVPFLRTLLNIEMEVPEGITSFENRDVYLVPVTREIRPLLEIEPAVIVDVGDRREEVWHVDALAHTSNRATHYFVDETLGVGSYDDLKKYFDEHMTFTFSEGDVETIRSSENVSGKVAKKLELHERELGMRGLIGQIVHEMGAAANARLKDMNYTVKNDGDQRLADLIGNVIYEWVTPLNYKLADLNASIMTRDHAAPMDGRDDIMEDLTGYEMRDLGRVESALILAWKQFFGIDFGSEFKPELFKLRSLGQKRFGEGFFAPGLREHNEKENDEYVYVYFDRTALIPRDRAFIECEVKNEWEKKPKKYFAVLDLKTGKVLEVYKENEFNEYTNKRLPQFLLLEGDVGVDAYRPAPKWLPTRYDLVKWSINTYVQHQLTIDHGTNIAHRMQKEADEQAKGDDAKNRYVMELSAEQYRDIVTGLVNHLHLDIESIEKLLEKKCYLVKLTPEVEKAFGGTMPMVVELNEGNTPALLDIMMPPGSHSSQKAVHIYLKGPEYDECVEFFKDGNDAVQRQDNPKQMELARVCGLPYSQSTVSGMAGRVAQEIGAQCGIMPYLYEYYRVAEKRPERTPVNNIVRKKLKCFLNNTKQSLVSSSLELTPVDLNDLTQRHDYLAGTAKDTPAKPRADIGESLADTARRALSYFYYHMGPYHKIPALAGPHGTGEQTDLGLYEESIRVLDRKNGIFCFTANTDIWSGDDSIVFVYKDRRKVQKFTKCFGKFNTDILEKEFGDMKIALAKLDPVMYDQHLEGLPRNLTEAYAVDALKEAWNIDKIPNLNLGNGILDPKSIGDNNGLYYDSIRVIEEETNSLAMVGRFNGEDQIIFITEDREHMSDHVWAIFHTFVYDKTHLRTCEPVLDGKMVSQCIFDPTLYRELILRNPQDNIRDISERMAALRYSAGRPATGLAITPSTIDSMYIFLKKAEERGVPLTFIFSESQVGLRDEPGYFGWNKDDVVRECDSLMAKMGITVPVTIERDHGKHPSDVENVMWNERSEKSLWNSILLDFTNMNKTHNPRGEEIDVDEITKPNDIYKYYEDNINALTDAIASISYIQDITGIQRGIEIAITEVGKKPTPPGHIYWFLHFLYIALEDREEALSRKLIRPTLAEAQIGTEHGYSSENEAKQDLLRDVAAMLGIFHLGEAAHGTSGTSTKTLAKYPDLGVAHAHIFTDLVVAEFRAILEHDEDTFLQYTLNMLQDDHKRAGKFVSNDEKKGVYGKYHNYNGEKLRVYNARYLRKDGTYSKYKINMPVWLEFIDFVQSGRALESVKGLMNDLDNLSPEDADKRRFATVNETILWFVLQNARYLLDREWSIKARERLRENPAFVQAVEKYVGEQFDRYAERFNNQGIISDLNDITESDLDVVKPITVGDHSQEFIISRRIDELADAVKRGKDKARELALNDLKALTDIPFIKDTVPEKVKEVLTKLEELSKEPVKESLRKLVKVAERAGREIPVFDDARYTLVLPSQFYKGREKRSHIDKYGEKFNIEVAGSGITRQDNYFKYITDLVENGADGNRIIALVSTYTTEKDLRKLKDKNIRYIRVNMRDLANMKKSYEDEENKQIRQQFQLYTYAMMLLARRIDDKLIKANSPVYQMLDYYINAHFHLDKMGSEEYIQAIIEGTVNTLIKGFLEYRPMYQRDLREEYNKIAPALISA